MIRKRNLVGEVLCMGRKIMCPSCNTVFDEDILKARNSENTCLACNAALDGGSDDSQTAPEELVTWYYYDLGGGTYYLDDKYTEEDENAKVTYIFQAPPRDVNGSSERAKEVLRREYKPDAFAPPDPDDISHKSPGELIKEGRCPRCGSSNISIVPRKWSPLTGFRTNKVDRVCSVCLHRF